jgi:hypothetical protein
MFKLERPASLGDVTVADVAEAGSSAAHIAAVKRWATAAWTAWAAHYAIIREWAK